MGQATPAWHCARAIFFKFQNCGQSGEASKTVNVALRRIVLRLTVCSFTQSGHSRRQIQRLMAASGDLALDVRDHPIPFRRPGLCDAIRLTKLMARQRYIYYEV